MDLHIHVICTNTYSKYFIYICTHIYVNIYIPNYANAVVIASVALGNKKWWEN